VQEGSPAGQRLVAGRYAVLGELGRGGVGVVWRAQDQVIGRQVALKELRIPPGLGRSEHDLFVQRVLREARTAGALNDPAIVTVYDVVPEGGAMYIVMELIEAKTLAELVTYGPLPERRAADLARQVLSALETAHAAGIVHRDIKPSNIMVLADGRVKLTDFGIAQATDDPSLTATGGIMGSPGYMAPELFQGKPPSPATDLWSLGATLFHVVEGRAPFQRDNTAATMHAIMYDDPQLHRCHGPLAAVIMGLLVHAVDQRLTAPQARELLAAHSSSAGEARTEIIPRITDTGSADNAERTALVDRERTTMVGARPRSTRSFGVESELTARPIAPPDGPNWHTDWAPEPKRGRRRAIWLSAAVAVLVLALTGTAIALSGSRNTVAAPSPTNAAHSTSTGSAPTTSGSTTVPPTSAATSTAAVPSKVAASITTVAGGKGGGGGAPVAPTSSKPPLTYVSITRYYNAKTAAHLTATPGSAIPRGFVGESVRMGRLLATPQPGTVKLYSCKTSGTDYFSSTDATGRCENQTTIGVLGYVYPSPQGGSALTLYRCLTKTTRWHYDSVFPDCEGNGTVEHVEGYEP